MHPRFSRFGQFGAQQHPPCPKREQDRHPPLKFWGQTRRASAAGISPNKESGFPSFRTSMYVYISIDKMFHVEHFSILQATFTNIFRGRGRPRHTEKRSAFRTSIVSQ